MKYRLEIRLRSEIEPRKISVDEPRPIHSPRCRVLVCDADMEFEAPEELLQVPGLSLISAYSISDQAMVFRASEYPRIPFVSLEEAVRPMIELMNKLDLDFALRTDDHRDFGALIDMFGTDKTRATISFQNEVAW